MRGDDVEVRSRPVAFISLRNRATIASSTRSAGSTRSVSFQIATDDQAETDRYWNAIVGNGGPESACGWCADRWGTSGRITPRALIEAMAAGGAEAKRAFDAMMTMKKIDVAAIEVGAARLRPQEPSFQRRPQPRRGGA